MLLLKASLEHLNQRLCLGRDLKRVTKQKEILLIPSKCFTTVNDVIHISDI